MRCCADRRLEMLTDREWEEIRYSLIEGGWFDFEVRPKTLKAIRRVVEQMSLDERGTLQERISVIFGPAPGKHGEVYPFELTQASEHQKLPSGMEYSPVPQCMVYLSPEIEVRSQKYVDSVVAHEFAHVLLHPFGGPALPSIEREADEKVRLWGFKPAYHNGEYLE